MFDVDVSEVPSLWPQFYERLRAGESIRVQEQGREVVWMSGVDPALMEKIHQQEVQGRIRIPARFGERGGYHPVAAIGGGDVGTVEAILEEREERR